MSRKVELPSSSRGSSTRVGDGPPLGRYGPCIGPSLGKIFDGLGDIEVILDGEALGRDLETGVCARFGTNQSIAKLERTIIERCVDPRDAGAVAGIVDDIKAETVEGGVRCSSSARVEE